MAEPRKSSADLLKEYSALRDRLDALRDETTRVENALHDLNAAIWAASRRETRAFRRATKGDERANVRD